MQLVAKVSITSAIDGLAQSIHHAGRKSIFYLPSKKNTELRVDFIKKVTSHTKYILSRCGSFKSYYE